MGANSEPNELPVVTTAVLSSDGDLARLLHHAVRSAFGAAAVTAEVLLRSLSDSSPPDPRATDPASLSAAEVADAVFGVGWQTARLVDRGAGSAVRACSPAIRLLMSPPLVPVGLTPVHLLRRASTHWSRERPKALASLTAWSSSMAPAAGTAAARLVLVDDLLELALTRVDVERLVIEVLTRLDVEELVARALVDVDVAQLVERSLSGVDLTPVVERIMSEMDVSAVVREAVSRIDVSDMVGDRVDVLATETIEEIRVDGTRVEGAVTNVVRRVLRRKPSEQ